MTIDPRFQKLIEAPITTVTQMHGDASSRVYYRVQTNDGKSYVMMQLPPGKAAVSEEITNFSGKMAELPFINVQKFLKTQGIPVPDIFTYDKDERLMLLEDCGETLIFTKVDKADDAERLHWYGKAVDLLCTIQKKCNSARPTDCVAMQRSFDDTLLNWEFDHFLEYAIDARRGEKMPERSREDFKRLTRLITGHIMELSYGFTHRDYQSRNLLVRNDELVVIDFQDALRGPFIYDMVALTRDSYVQLSDAVVEQLLSRYATASSHSLSDVKRAYDLVTVQRKMKDAGRFVYIDRVRGNPNYLGFIPASLAYIKSALSRLQEGKELLEVLTPYIPEWQA